MAILYYAKMDETSGSTVADSISGLNDTSVTSAIVQGVLGNARKITGAGTQPVYPTTNASLVKNSTEFTASFLVKFDTYTGRIFFIQGTSNQLIYGRFNGTSVFEFVTASGGTVDTLSYTHAFTTTKWHNIQLKWGTTKEVWLDGKIVASNTPSASSIAFGNGGSGNGFSFLGLRNDGALNGLCSMDEVIVDNNIWSSAKSKNQHSYYKGFI